MFRLNNRGQSLVMFVVIIPIFLLIITLIYDVGNAIYEKSYRSLFIPNRSLELTRSMGIPGHLWLPIYL